MIESEKGEEIGLSSVAAIEAIKQVIPSRILMAVPGMMIPPIVMSKLERTRTFTSNPWLKAPTTVRQDLLIIFISQLLLCYLYCNKCKNPNLNFEFLWLICLPSLFSFFFLFKQLLNVILLLLYHLSHA